MTHLVEARVLDSESEWLARAAAGADLWSRSMTRSTPLCFDWLRTWWGIYGEAYEAKLRIIEFVRGRDLIGLLPLYLRPVARLPLAARRLGFISTGEAEVEETCADYMDLICSREDAAACLAALGPVLAGLSWDVLELTDVPDNSPLLVDRCWCPGPLELIPRGSCPIANLSGGFDEYLRRLSHKTRQHSRQYLRAAERAGASFELATSATVDSMFDDLVRLHQERWIAEGRPGAFASPRFVAFHRSMARQWVPTGRAILARLSVGGVAAVVLYGFVTSGKFDFYQSGVRRDAVGLASPGTTANLMLMNALLTQGVDRYDFLRGSSAYKERLATENVALFSLRCWRPSARAALLRSGGKLGRMARRGLQYLRPAPGYRGATA